MQYVLMYLTFGIKLFVVLSILYIILMTIKNKIGLEKLEKLPKPLYYLLYGVGLLGFGLDILFRVMYGSWITLPPYGKDTKATDYTFTHQLKEILRLKTEIKKDSFWYKFSLALCKALEFFDPEHCNLEGILHDQSEKSS